MTEAELGSLLSAALREQGWKMFKLHNDLMQRGLPDYVLWRDGGQKELFELKRATTGAQAERHLSAGQRSVLESLAKTSTGTLLVFGDQERRTYLGGVQVWRGEDRRCTPVIGVTRAEFIQKLSSEIIAAFTAPESEGAVDFATCDCPACEPESTTSDPNSHFVAKVDGVLTVVRAVITEGGELAPAGAVDGQVKTWSAPAQRIAAESNS